MNPIPPTASVPTTPFIVDGTFELMLIFTVIAIFGFFGLMLWTACTAGVERTRLLCPKHMRLARVVFRLAPDGRRTDVIRCSERGRRRIDCGKACLPQAGAA
jgi:hypothetical protein